MDFNYSGNFVSSISGDITFLDPDYETELLADADGNYFPYYKCPRCGEVVTYDKVSWSDCEGEYVCDNCYEEIEIEEEE